MYCRKVFGNAGLVDARVCLHLRVLTSNRLGALIPVLRRNTTDTVLIDGATYRRVQTAGGGSYLPDSRQKISLSAVAKPAGSLQKTLQASSKVKSKQQLTTREKVAASQLGTAPFDLRRWRADVSDLRWHWGTKEAEDPSALDIHVYPEITTEGSNVCLADCAVQVLRTATIEEKIRLTHKFWRSFADHGMVVGEADPPEQPARPIRPKLVPSRQIPKAKESGLPKNVYMLLNLAHVELNAIDLAWDTVARFAKLGLPMEFYADFAHVAEDESRHLGWCLQRLQELGFAYGDMPAHNMLWQGAVDSSDEVMARLVMVPCSQEARGLDAGPRLVEFLMSHPDHRSAAIVDRISREELAHVSVGTFWFRHLCQALSQEAGGTFKRWLAARGPGLLVGQFNHPARVQAGLEQSWYDKEFWSRDLAEGTPLGLRDLSNGQRQALQGRLMEFLDAEASAS